MDANKDIRRSLENMRRAKNGDNIIKEQAKRNNLDMREMLKRSRRMNEFVDAPSFDTEKDNAPNDEENTETIEFNKKEMTDVDKQTQKEKIENAFDNQDVFVDIKEFYQYEDENGKPLVFFLGGVIDGVITFTLKVGKTEATSGIEWTATPEYTSDQRNESIIETLKNFYKEFYEEWRESLY